ncbi:MAG: acyl-CoA dehydrogenase family protein [Oligoflexus sp.]
MNWELTDEEKLLKQSAEEYFQEKLPIHVLRFLRDHNDENGYVAESWQEMAELGWAGILIPEDFGGLDFGYRGIGLIMEAAGRSLAPSPLLSTVVCASTLIRQLATQRQKATLLPDIAAGKITFAVAHEEWNHHSEGEMDCNSTRSGEGFIINGHKKMVIHGHTADKFLVLARSSDNDASSSNDLSCFVVDRHQAGVVVKKFRMVDGLPCAHVQLNDVQVNGEDLLGHEGMARPAYEFMLDAARSCLAAEMFGSAAEAFSMTLAYLKERKQFGQVIGSFQALQHRMAQMYSELEICRSVVQRALSALDENDSKRAVFASLAKAKVGDIYQHVAREAIQLHGGIGMTDEHNIGFFLKRSRITGEWFGNRTYHRARYARLMDF